jgi:hypothetical protein
MFAILPGHLAGHHCGADGVCGLHVYGAVSPGRIAGHHCGWTNLGKGQWETYLTRPQPGTITGRR